MTFPNTVVNNILGKKRKKRLYDEREVLLNQPDPDDAWESQYMDYLEGR